MHWKDCFVRLAEIRPRPLIPSISLTRPVQTSCYCIKYNTLVNITVSHNGHDLVTQNDLSETWIHSTPCFYLWGSYVTFKEMSFSDFLFGGFLKVWVLQLLVCVLICGLIILSTLVSLSLLWRERTVGFGLTLIASFFKECGFLEMRSSFFTLPLLASLVNFPFFHCPARPGTCQLAALNRNDFCKLNVTLSLGEVRVRDCCF